MTPNKSLSTEFHFPPINQVVARTQKRKGDKVVLARLLCQYHSGVCMAHNINSISSAFTWDLCIVLQLAGRVCSAQCLMLLPATPYSLPHVQIWKQDILQVFMTAYFELYVNCEQLK